MSLLKWRLKRSGNNILLLLAAGALMASPANAQINSVDPNEAIDSDLERTAAPANNPAPAGNRETVMQDGVPTDPAPAAPSAPLAIPTKDTYQEDDLIGAAEGVFGKGAQGLGKLIEDILKKQGRPNGYIVGRETGGSFILGLRYGSGTLNHRVEGEKPVYWTGPSLGLDAGANGGSAFILVYNLYDTEDLYHNFGAAEGAAYVGGGFNVGHMRRGDVVLIPIRVGAGLRLGMNVGYMRFSKKQRWRPF
ncbi:DUF1134 domain-containing protein [Sphingorhabdus sp.]|uniref:DUF1134 domain-containing protein n=1 Tax=Sphingorhabdus sp. TaxID=1902408 RepID=UPI0038FD0424